MSEPQQKLETTFVFDRDTKRTRRFEEDPGGPPIIGTLYVQQWALRQLTAGILPNRVRVSITVYYEVEARQQIFSDLIDARTEELEEHEIYRSVAREWGITVDALAKIEQEGIQKEWIESTQAGP